MAGGSGVGCWSATCRPPWASPGRTFLALTDLHRHHRAENVRLGRLPERTGSCYLRSIATRARVTRHEHALLHRRRQAPRTRCLPARLPGHLRARSERLRRSRRQGRRRGRSRADRRRAVHQGGLLPRAHLSPGPPAPPLAPGRRQGPRGELRTHFLAAGAGDDRRSLSPDHRQRRRRGDRSLQLRRQFRPARLRLDGSPLLPPSRCCATRPHDLRQRRRDGLPREHRCERRFRRRERRRCAPDHHLGQQQRRLEPALLAPGAGSETTRRPSDRHRSLPHGDRRQVRPAHRAAARNRQRAGPRADARADPRRASRPRLHRPAHARLRRPQGTRSAIPAGTGSGDLWHRRSRGRAARARIRPHDSGSDPHQLRHQPHCGWRHGAAHAGLPAGAHWRLATPCRRHPAFQLGQLPGGQRRPRTP